MKALAIYNQRKTLLVADISIRLRDPFAFSVSVYTILCYIHFLKRLYSKKYERFNVLQITHNILFLYIIINYIYIIINLLHL